MKIRVVSSRDEIFTLSPNERVVHLAFRPSNKDVFGLVETCPKVEVIQLPQSYRRTISKSIEMFLEMQRVQLLEGDVWGHRKDLNEYYEVPSSVIGKIKEMKSEGKSTEDIKKEVSRRTKTNPEMIGYILMREISA
jgi:hypothetical protein